MSKDDQRAPDRAQTTHAADAAEREDPMTSFEPEAGQAAPAAEPAAGAAPAARKPRGNGGAELAREPGQARPEEAPPAPAQPAPPEPTEPGAAAATEQGEAAQPSELELARQEAADYYDRLLRLQAEFENYKKRVSKEHADALRFALAPLAAEVAAIVDNLERAAEHARKEPSDGVTALLSGIEMVIKQMSGALGRFGVTRIASVGQPFDPGRHEAIHVVETDDVPENRVLEEYQAGYLLHERVIRPARVSVSRRANDAGRKAPPPES